MVNGNVDRGSRHAGKTEIHANDFNQVQTDVCISMKGLVHDHEDHMDHVEHVEHVDVVDLTAVDSPLDMLDVDAERGNRCLTALAPSSHVDNTMRANKRKAGVSVDDEHTVIGRLKRVQLMEPVERGGSGDEGVRAGEGVGLEEGFREGEGAGRAQWYLDDVEADGMYTDVNKMLGEAHLEMIERRSRTDGLH